MRRSFQGGVVVAALASMAVIPNCSSSKREFGEPSAGAGGAEAGSAGKLGAGHTGAGVSGRSNTADGGASDRAGASGEAGADSSQGGDTPASGEGGGAGTTGNQGNAGASGNASVAGGPAGGTAGAVGGGGNSAGGGGCATACASYQFCSTNKCLPTYANTRVLPATDQSSGSGEVKSAIVLTDKPKGDVIVQLSGELNLYDPGASMQTKLTGAGYVRYTADGKLAWFRTRDALTGSSDVSRESAIALVPPSDFAVNYVKYDAATGPVAGTYSARLARVNGNSGNRTWEAKYPSTTNASGGWPMVVPRTTQGDFLTLDSVLNYQAGQACRVVDNGTSGTVTCSGSSYAMGAAASADGTTAWIWGAPGVTKSVPLNPLSTTEWPLTANPYKFGGEDAFILGIRGPSGSVGPWISEGDYGPLLGLTELPGGDLAVTARGVGYMTFNGGQSLLENTGSVLFRLDSTGHILWRTSLAQTPAALVTAPGGRIAVLSTASGVQVQLFNAANGALLSTIPLPPTSYPVMVAGETDLVVLGDYSAAFDFDPGPGTDKPASTRGVYISRYSF